MPFKFFSCSIALVRTSSTLLNKLVKADILILYPIIEELEKEMATHSSILARRIPGMGEPGGLPSMGSHKVGHD